MKKALIIAVHPDDETIGCGGTMLKLKEMGWEVYWLMLTAAFPGQAWSDEIIKKRREEIVEVAKIYGVSATLNLKYPAATLDQQSLGEVIGKISGILADVKPDWVFLPNRSDVHSDHRVGFEAAWAACKWFRAPSISKVLMFECVSETEYAPPFGEGAFIPNFYIDITSHLSRKLEIMDRYKSELQSPPFPRSREVVEALARYRGSRMGAHHAEAFMILFESLK